MATLSNMINELNKKTASIIKNANTSSGGGGRRLTISSNVAGGGASGGTGSSRSFGTTNTHSGGGLRLESPSLTDNSLVSAQKASKVEKTPTTSGGSISVGVSTPSVGNADAYKIDLSDILAAYSQSADVQKQAISESTAARKQALADALASNIKTLETSESTQRENLLTSLKRFQEDTANARKQQQSNFNASRADLEAQAFMANRAATQSAAARGLGGSGLQQLAQLQNMINQSGEVNQLAAANTETLNALAQELARQEEDTTTNLNTLAKEIQNRKESLTTEQKNALNELLVEEGNRLKEIEANTTSLKEQLKYQEAVRAENARMQAEQFAAEMQARNASIAAQYDLYNRQKEDEKAALAEIGLNNIGIVTSSGLKAIENAYNTASSKNKSPKKIQQAITDAYNTQLDNIYAYAIEAGLNTNQISNYEQQLLNSYNNFYKLSNSKENKDNSLKSTLSSLIPYVY